MIFVVIKNKEKAPILLTMSNIQKNFNNFVITISLFSLVKYSFIQPQITAIDTVILNNRYKYIERVFRKKKCQKYISWYSM